MDKFTASETDRINILYAEGFKGEITDEDIKLISRMEYMRAYNDIQTEIKADEIKANAKVRADGTQSVFEQALANMSELHARALARMDTLEKRERPSIEQAQKDEYTVAQKSVVVRDGK